MEPSIYNTLWFMLVAVVLTGYAVLDGFDLGAGINLFLAGKTEHEREVIQSAIGPVWNGNEVWLLAGGGGLVVSFPLLYASAFSGFYIALTLVLWMLILRGVSLEFRHQVESPGWRKTWDVVFCISSSLLAVLFGVAVANVVRGVPMGEGQNFTAPLLFMLNPYALVGGVFSLLMLGLHGAAYLAAKTEGAVQERARGLVRTLWWPVVLLAVVGAVYSHAVRPDWLVNYTANVLLWVFPLIAAVSLINVFVATRAERDKSAFAGTMGTIIGVLFSMGAGLYPKLLPALPGSTGGDLTIVNTAAPDTTQRLGLIIFCFGAVPLALYIWYVYKTWSGKVTGGFYHH